MKKLPCHQCGEAQQGWAFQEPDEVFALNDVDKYLRVRSNADLCTLDESRFFLRAHLLLPLSEKKGVFSWGVWVEVSKHDHDVYLGQIIENGDGSSEPPLEGRIANSLPGYRSTMGLVVEVQLGEPGDRPSLWLPARSRHTLAMEQAKGISSKRQHQLLAACGYVGNPEGDKVKKPRHARHSGSKRGSRPRGK